jgi:hypothetical protein
MGGEGNNNNMQKAEVEGIAVLTSSHLAAVHRKATAPLEAEDEEQDFGSYRANAELSVIPSASASSFKNLSRKRKSEGVVRSGYDDREELKSDASGLSIGALCAESIVSNDDVDATSSGKVLAEASRAKKTFLLVDGAYVRTCIISPFVTC